MLHELEHIASEVPVHLAEVSLGEAVAAWACSLARLWTAVIWIPDEDHIYLVDLWAVHLVQWLVHQAG